MKRLIIILLIVVCPLTTIWAKDNSLRRNYVNFNFSMLKMKRNYLPAINSNYGASFTIGKTYYLHKKPIVKMIRFGIDATWLDVNYLNYKLKTPNSGNIIYDERTTNFHQTEIAMQVGPSISISPITKLNIQGYFRYAPSFSCLFIRDSFWGNYANFFVGGASVSYGIIGLGIEARFGNCKYKRFFGEDDNYGFGRIYGNLPKTKFSGFRAYITLRF